MNDAVRLAVGTLTALRVPPPSTIEPPVPGRAMALAPPAGLIPGVAALAVAWVALQLDLWSGIAAVLVVGTFSLTTRGLHLDGLADTADAFAASYDRDKALTVMRRGDTGPAGMTAVILVLLLQCAALTQILQATGFRFGADPRSVAVVVAVAVAARVAVPLACRAGVPAARPEGLGATVAGSVSRNRLAAAVIATAAACSLIGLIGGFAWWAGLLAVLAVTLGTAVLIRRAVNRFGGITGDVLGAAVETGTTLALLVFAATLP